MTNMLQEMFFGFEYEILYTCDSHKNYVSFTKLKNVFDKIQNAPKDQKWKVTPDGSLTSISNQETWRQSEDSDFIYGDTRQKHTRCYDHDHEYKHPDREYDGTAEIISPVIAGYDAIAPAFEHFNTLLKTVENDLKINFFNNSSTSNHVHLSHSHLLSLPGAVKAFMAWLYFEPLFVAMVGYRRRDNMYCARTQINWKTAKMKELFASFGKVIGRDLQNMPVPNFLALLADLRKLLKLMPNVSASYSQIKPHLDSMTKGVNAQGMTYLQTDPGELNEYAILDFFVDAVGNQSENCRYVSLNMTNLANEDQDDATIEVRLKHGSNNMDANAKWVQLLAAFFAASLDNPCVTAHFDDTVKQRFYDILLRSSANTQNLYASDAAFLKTQFKAFMSHVKADGVKEAMAYWHKKVQTLKDPDVALVEVAKIQRVMPTKSKKKTTI